MENYFLSRTQKNTHKDKCHLFACGLKDSRDVISLALVRPDGEVQAWPTPSETYRDTCLGTEMPLSWSQLFIIGIQQYFAAFHSRSSSRKRCSSCCSFLTRSFTFTELSLFDGADDLHSKNSYKPLLRPGWWWWAASGRPTLPRRWGWRPGWRWVTRHCATSSAGRPSQFQPPRLALRSLAWIAGAAETSVSTARKAQNVLTPKKQTKTSKYPRLTISLRNQPPVVF